jgi:photosystem II stability/assembly factor-like uncharacterized protein
VKKVGQTLFSGRCRKVLIFLIAGLLNEILVLPRVGAAELVSSSTLIDFFSLDGRQLWAFADSSDHKRFLFRSTDGGTSWNATQVPFDILRVFFTDGNEGWGVAAESVGTRIRTFCVHTSDSGRTWERLGTLTNHDELPSGIAFEDSKHGWVVGEGYMGVAFVFETADGGRVWSQLDWKTQPASGLYGVRVEKGVAYTWSGGAGGSGIYELHHGALPMQISSRETMNFALLAEDSVVLTSQSFVYRRSGQSLQWVQVLEAADSTFRDMSFANSDIGCVAGGEIYCTKDGGLTWTPRPQPRQRDKAKGDYVQRLHLVDPLRVWAISSDAIFLTTDGGYTWSQMDFFDGQNKPLTRLRDN